MGILDSAMGQMGGGMDLGALAARVGLSEEQVKTGLAALAKAAGEHGDTLQLASQRTGLPIDKLQPLLAAAGGEVGIGAAAGMLGAGGVGKAFRL